MTYLGESLIFPTLCFARGPADMLRVQKNGRQVDFGAATALDGSNSRHHHEGPVQDPQAEPSHTSTT